MLLVHRGGREIYINVEQIQQLEPNEPKGTLIRFVSGEQISVDEGIEYFRKMIDKLT